MAGKRTPDFAKMTMDELVAWRVAKKAEITSLREELRASNEEYNGRILAAERAALLKRAGLPEGTKIVLPEPAELTAEAI